MGCCTSSEPIEWEDLSAKCAKEGVVFEEKIENISGKRRNVVSWFPAEGQPKAILFVVHGLNEHTLPYYQVAHAFVKKGYGVLAMDHVSHGKSDGVRGVIRDHRDLFNDLIEFINTHRKKYETLPAFVLAHSMGTLAAIMAINKLENIKAMVLSGTALFAGPAAASLFGCRCLFPLSRTALARCVTGITASLDPSGPAAPLEVMEITSDPDELDQMRRDPRRGPTFVTNKTAKELLSLINLCKTEVPRITLPFLCIHGGADLIALKEGSEFVFKHAGTELARRKLHIFEGLKHECFHEIPPHNTESIEFVVNYVESQLGNDGDLAVSRLDDIQLSDAQV